MTKTPPEKKKKGTKKRILNSAYGLVMIQTPRTFIYPGKLMQPVVTKLRDFVGNESLLLYEV